VISGSVKTVNTSSDPGKLNLVISTAILIAPNVALLKFGEIGWSCNGYWIGRLLEGM